jgi:hypothetical protein
MRWWIGLGLLLATQALTLGADARQATEQLTAAFPDVQLYAAEGQRPTRVWGTIFGVGATPELSAATFVQSHAQVFGLPADELVPGRLADGQITQPVMYEEETGAYKFTLVYYHQERGGVPVYQSDLRLLVRNEPDNPLVLAASSLRDLGDFAVPASTLRALADAQAVSAALAEVPSLTTFTSSTVVIWAGTPDAPTTPTLALTFVADNYAANDGQPQRWRYIADAATGKILRAENLIRFVNVGGTVSGVATATANKADICAAEVSMPMRYAKVVMGETVVYADSAGKYSVPNSGTGPVTLQSPMEGRYFTVSNFVGTTETVPVGVTPPGPANISHNASNVQDGVRSQVNAYVQANIVRDFVLKFNPSYPTIATQFDFPLVVNRDDYYCPGNAWYDGSSLNFCSPGGGSPNTAFSSVVHHEYGHHLVDSAGSGQDAYGEGMGDVIGVLIADDPNLAVGFEGDCYSGLRTASNTMQYPCTGEIHYCGQLLSGCVWSIRNQLKLTHPNNYIEILANLAINAMMLHSGGSVTPQIAIDYLTLDDNDGVIANGTPHYPELCAGFGAHSMGCPALQTRLTVTPAWSLDVSGPAGGPLAPTSETYTLFNSGTTAFNYQVTATAPWVTIAGGSGTLAGGATTTVTIGVDASILNLADGTYTATVNFVNTNTHSGDATRTVTLTVGGPRVIYEWNMDSDPQWTISGGTWAWGHPTGGAGDHGGPDPTGGHTGANVYGYNLAGGYANNLAIERYLTTAAIDCSQLSQVRLRFWRWLGVERNAYDHAAVRLSTNGTTWVTLWQNPSTTLDDQAWVPQDFDLSLFADGKPAVYIRWVMGATDLTFSYCGWNIDDVQIWGVSACVSPTIDTPPASLTVTAGQAAEFTVTASGTGTLSYQWRKDTADIDGATEATYTIPATTVGDAGSYDCVVSNGCGAQLSAAATLTVNDMPPVPCKGDGNCDFAVNWRDIDYLVAAQNDNMSAWGALFPVEPQCSFFNLDTDDDGHVNWRDIDPFIARMNSTCP